MCVVQAGVKFAEKHVKLLKNVINVLDPFFRVTVQLSRDDAGLSEVTLKPNLYFRLWLVVAVGSFNRCSPGGAHIYSAQGGAG